MIVTKLIGGVGNQMFQYAVARRLSQIHHTELKLDIYAYESYKLRKFELDKFNISAQIATKNEIEKFIKIPKNIFEKIIFNLIPSVQKKSRFYYEEKYYHFDKHVLSLPDNVYLSGYWQSEKYFIDIEDIIRKELTVKQHPDQQNQDVLGKIKSVNSVGIHIRQGDFATDVSTISLHGLYGIDYLQKAIKMIAEKVASPHFYVFSDDILWARNNLKIKFPITFIDLNIGKKDYEDIRLMYSCKHNIIVNSTFGWWGAWLNNNRSKIVITPKIWYKDGPTDTYDLIPKSWIKI